MFSTFLKPIAEKKILDATIGNLVLFSPSFLRSFPFSSSFLTPLQRVAAKRERAQGGGHRMINTKRVDFIKQRQRMILLISPFWFATELQKNKAYNGEITIELIGARNLAKADLFGPCCHIWNLHFLMLAR